MYRLKIIRGTRRCFGKRLFLYNGMSGFASRPLLASGSKRVALLFLSQAVTASLVISLLISNYNFAFGPILHCGLCRISVNSLSVAILSEMKPASFEAGWAGSAWAVYLRRLDFFTHIFGVKSLSRTSVILSTLRD